MCKATSPEISTIKKKGFDSGQERKEGIWNKAHIWHRVPASQLKSRFPIIRERKKKKGRRKERKKKLGLKAEMSETSKVWRRLMEKLISPKKHPKGKSKGGREGVQSIYN